MDGQHIVVIHHHMWHRLARGSTACCTSTARTLFQRCFCLCFLFHFNPGGAFFQSFFSCGFCTPFSKGASSCASSPKGSSAVTGVLSRDLSCHSCLACSFILHSLDPFFKGVKELLLLRLGFGDLLVCCPFPFAGVIVTCGIWTWKKTWSFVS